MCHATFVRYLGAEVRFNDLLTFCLARPSLVSNLLNFGICVISLLQESFAIEELLILYLQSKSRSNKSSFNLQASFSKLNQLCLVLNGSLSFVYPDFNNSFKLNPKVAKAVKGKR